MGLWLKNDLDKGEINFKQNMKGRPQVVYIQPRFFRLLLSVSVFLSVIFSLCLLCLFASPSTLILSPLSLVPFSLSPIVIERKYK